MDNQPKKRGRKVGSKKNNVENKKKLLKEGINTIVLFTGKEYYTKQQIDKLFKLDNKVKSKSKIYEKRLDNLVIKKNFYKDCDLTECLYMDIIKRSIGINRIKKYLINSNKKHLLLLNDCGLLWHINKWNNIELQKCICGNYCRSDNCNIDHSGSRYYFRFKKFRYTKKHNYNLNQIINNEKKISEYGDKLRFCVDCNKPLKLESVKQHFNSNQHKNNCKH